MANLIPHEFCYWNVQQKGNNKQSSIIKMYPTNKDVINMWPGKVGGKVE